MSSMIKLQQRLVELSRASTDPDLTEEERDIILDEIEDIEDEIEKEANHLNDYYDDFN
jgi:flagellin-like hook-associated protein FlgL